MIDFEPSAIQRSRQEAAREFTTQHVLPVAAAIDREGEFPWDLVEKGVRAGFTTMLIPTAYGGGGYDHVSAGLVLEELGAGCAGVATIFGASILGVGPIVLLGTEIQKQRLLRRITRDIGGQCLCAFAVTEATAGTAAASGHPKFGVQLRARREGESYRLTGRKCFISNGSVASLFSVLARTDPMKAALGGLSFFVVDAHHGVRIGRIEEKMGQRACPVAELLLDEVEISSENLLGSEGLGAIGLVQTLSFSLPLVAAISVGLARTATQYALSYARKNSLSNDQGVAMRLFDMAMLVDTARDLVWRALWQNDQRTDQTTGKLRGAPNLKLATMAKVFASDACVRVVDGAMQVVGPEALTGAHPLGKLVRDAKLMQIFEGTNQIHRITAERLL
ncbi:MAG: acyl-CoA dehydrogenase family protein [Candidatus Binatia bacterium]